MTLPKLVILDRDSTLCFASSNPDSPLYYLADVKHLVIKPGVHEAIQLLQAHGIPMMIATRQRCISRGLVSRETVNLINTRLIRLLDFDPIRVMVGENEEDKRKMLEQVIQEASILPSEMVLFDDSPREIKIAQSLGISAYDGTDLLSAVKTLLQIT